MLFGMFPFVLKFSALVFRKVWGRGGRCLPFIYTLTDIFKLRVNIMSTDIIPTFCMYVFMYIGFKTSFYIVRHLDSIASYLPTGLHLGFFRSWPPLYFPSSFSSVFLVLSFVSASTSILFWVIFLLPFFEHGRTM